MNQGGETLNRQVHRGTNFIQTAFDATQGVTNPNVPHLLYEGIVIDINFSRSVATTTASLLPPFSVYAKIIGEDDNTTTPESDSNRTYYPPFFPMHNLCIPEIGELVLILKKSPTPSSVGYYIGRVNDCTPLNISYAKDYVNINDSSASNSYRYGFSFDVKKLRSKYEALMPSSETNNISIPITYGDVVQQGRSKTYVRHSFNKNNKEGVLEQGIGLPGQPSSNQIDNSFKYIGEGSSAGLIDNPVTTSHYFNEETGVLEEQATVTNVNYLLSDDKQVQNSYDPSIGETSTKTIHFIDSSIKRLGNYNFQSQKVEPQGDLQAEDRSIIANVADEIYNISSKEISGGLYRQVLGEKLVTQQKQTYNILKEVLTTVQGFAQTTQVLLNAFLDHTHALPRIDLNLEKEIKSKDLYRTAPRFIKQPDQIINTPGRSMRVKTGTRRVKTPYGGYREVPIYQTQNVAGTTIRVSQPPKIIPGKIKERNVKQKINFEAIIGGAENPRFTAPIQTQNDDPQNPSSMGLKTSNVHDSLEKTIASFTGQQERLNDLSLKISAFLSNNQFIN